MIGTAKAQQHNTIATVAGGGNIPAKPVWADLPGPNAVAEDAAGNIYLAPPNSYYILLWTQSSNTLSIFAGTGIEGGGGDGGPATAANLIGPAALALDVSGNLYIADANKIRCIAAANGACGGVSAGQINTIAGIREACTQSWGVCGDGGPAIKAQFDLPQALFADNSGNLFVADTGDNRIRLIANGIVTTVVGTGHPCGGGTGNPCADGGPATQALLNLPHGIAEDASGNLYISDSRDQRIRYVDKSSGNISTFAGTGAECNNSQGACGDGGLPANALVHTPGGIFLDASGNLYIADTLDFKIRMATTGSKPTMSTIAGTGIQGYAGDGRAPLSANLDEPIAVVADSSGNVTFADTGNQRVRRVSGGIITTLAGGGNGGDNASPVKATLADDTTVAWDTNGTNFYIADASNNRVREVTPGTSGVITTVAGTGSLGFSGDNGPATKATFNAPNGVAVDASGNIFIVDTGNLRVREVNASTGVVTTVAGNGISCLPRKGICGDGGPATQANLNTPTSIAIDTNGNYYIADWVGCRVRVVDSTGTINTLAGNGECGYTGDGGPGPKAKLNYPYGVAVDANHNVYIPDSENNVVRCVVGSAGGCASKSAVGTIVTYAFNGTRSFGGDGGPALKAAMDLPLEAAVDPAGNLFVGGGVDQVVRRIDAATQTVSTVAGNPFNPTLGGFSGDGGPSRQAVMQNSGLSVNGAQQLLIADAGNNRIRQVDMIPGVKRITKSINFGGVTVGKTSPPMPAKIKNDGLADLAISGFAFSGKNKGDFAIATKNCGSQLAPDLSCHVEITFTPHAKGARSASLVVSDSIGKQDIKLTGTGQ